MSTQELHQIPIIDVDTHYNEPHDLWTSRAPAKLKSRVPRIVATDGGEKWIFENDVDLLPTPGLCVIGPSGEKTYGTFSLTHSSEMHPGATDPKARLGWMDEQGIQAQVIYPNVGLNIDTIMGVNSGNEMLDFIFRAYNDYMGEVQEAGGGRLFPMAMLPLWDVKASVRECIRAHEELGMTGLNLPAGAMNLGLPALSDPCFDPLWEVAQDKEMSINFHIGGGGVDTTPWTSPSPSCDSAIISTLAIGSNIRCLTNLMFCGVLDRFPRLNFVSVESGFGWIPFLLELAEYQFDENGVTGLELRPTEYFKRQIYASYWFEKDAAPAVEKLGADSLMFETDFPHPTCLYPGVREHIDSSMKNISFEDQKKLLWDNAARLYHVSPPN